MNIDIVEGNLKQFSGWVMESWGALTDNARVTATGVYERNRGRNQARYGAAKEQAAIQLREFQHRNREWDPSRD